MAETVLPVKRYLVDEAVAELLRSNVRDGLDVGVGVLPVDDDVVPAKYVVLYPVPGGGVTGPDATPEADVRLWYQATCVGVDRRQTQWVADEVARVLFSRGRPGNLAFPLVLGDGLVEMGRSAPAGRGAATFLEGVWQTIEQIEVVVTRA